MSAHQEFKFLVRKLMSSCVPFLDTDTYKIAAIKINITMIRSKYFAISEWLQFPG